MLGMAADSPLATSGVSRKSLRRAPIRVHGVRSAALWCPMSNKKSRIPGIAEGLRTQLRNWLCNALGKVLALPTLSVIQKDVRAAASPALARKRFTIDEVLFATGHDEVCPDPFPASLRPGLRRTGRPDVSSIRRGGGSTRKHTLDRGPLN